MNIIVCVKRVPMTQEVDLEIGKSKIDIRKDMLAYVMNEWDNYAIEEAVLQVHFLGQGNPFYTHYDVHFLYLQSSSNS